MRTSPLFVFAALALSASPALAQDAPSPAAPPPPSAAAPAAPTTTAATAARREDTAPQSFRDAPLEYRVEARLGELRGVDLSDVHVRSVRGAVTLYGTVADDATRTKLLIAANGVEGVRVVRDETSLAPRGALAVGGGPADDARIATQVHAALARDAGVVGGPLAVSASRGVVSLRGHVATYEDARRVLHEARAVPGVRAVRSALTVNESVVVVVGGATPARSRARGPYIP